MSVKVLYLGHSAFQLTGSKGKLLIDPYLTDNPRAAIKAKDVEANVIVVTHGHGDHLGDAIDIAKRTGATIFATFELANYCQSKGAKVMDGHLGGTYHSPLGKIKLFPAFHSSSIDGQLIGMPSSVVVSMDGKHIYHAGDTALFGDMSLIAEQYDLDAALLPIGGHYTMDIDDAVRAEEFLRAKNVVPMHYKTWESIEVDPKDFEQKIAKQGIGRPVLLKPGESFELD